MGESEAMTPPMEARKSNVKANYVDTDAGSGEVEAKSLNAAIADYFETETPKGAKNLRELKARFKRYAAAGGWCFIDENDERVVEIGSDR